MGRSSGSTSPPRFLVSVMQDPCSEARTGPASCSSAGSPAPSRCGFSASPHVSDVLTRSSMTRARLNFPGALPSTEGSFPGGLGRVVLLAWCQVPLQLGSMSPPGTLLRGHLSKESPVWVGV